MTSTPKSHVVIVDDEPQVLAAVEDQLEDRFVVHAVTSGKAALELLNDLEGVSVLLSDQRMPGMTGDELFARASEISDATRVLITGFADLDAVVRAVNRGNIFGYVTKPWDAAELHLMLHKADEHHKLVQALRHERDLLRNLMDNTPDLILFKDLKGRLIRVNRAFARFRGLERAEKAQGMLHGALLPAGVAERVSARDAEVIRTKSPIEAEDAEPRPDGSTVWLSKTTAPVVDKAGHVESIVSIARDVTTRKAHEQRIARLTRMHQMLSGINTTIVRIGSEDELFDETCRLAVHAGGFRLVYIRMSDETRGVLRPVASAGPDALTIEPLDVGPAAPAETRRTTAYRAFRERRAEICNDLASDALQTALRHEAVKMGVRSVISLPIVAGGEAVGVITLAADEVNYFDPEEVRLLEELAGDVGFAIDTLHNKQRVAYLAMHDPLTGLGNRAWFHERLKGLVGSTRDTGESFAVVTVNLKRFRSVNETLGMHAGDDLLRKVAERLSKAIGKETLARLNADVFGAILEKARNAGEAAREVAALRDALAPAFELSGRELRVESRFGVALYPADGESADSLAANAEAALNKGRGADDTMTFYTAAINARVAEQLDLETRLRRAIEERQFVLHYQPKVNATSGAIVGAEALIRWNDPREGLVSPGRFIPVLEETGMIVEAGLWALEEAARTHRRFTADGVACPRISVNVSPVQMRRRDFPREVADAVCRMDERHGVDLELTESQLMESMSEAVRKLGMLRAGGFGVAIDDFGTGYSSLGYLAKLPLDALKIDRSFVVAMPSDANSMAIVSTIINLAHSFSLRVIAEGVETEEQLKLLRLLRCDEIQGYVFHKPMPEAQFLELLSKGTPSPNSLADA